MTERKHKACTFEFVVDRIVDVIDRPGNKVRSIQIEKGTRMSGVPTAKVLHWNGQNFEAFDLLMGSGALLLDIWYESVTLVD